MEKKHWGYIPSDIFESVKNIILKILKESKHTKLKMILDCKMQRIDAKTGKIKDPNPGDSAFHSDIELNLEGRDENELFDKMITRIDENIKTFQQGGSDWVFVSINQLEIHFANWKPLSGSSYIPLPPKIKNKRAVINMKNEDNQCFKWCVVRALNPVERDAPQITKKLKDQSERLDWSGLRFPVDLKQIKIFEKFNPQISINVYGYDDRVVYPLRVFENKKRPTHVDLLLIFDKNKTQYYCLIQGVCSPTS